MKKIVTLLLVGLLVLGVVSCGTDKKTDQTPTEETKVEQTKEESKEAVKKEETKTEEKKESKTEPAKETMTEGKKDQHEIKVGETVTIGDFEVTVNALSKVKTTDGKKDVVKIVYSWKNNSASPIGGNLALIFAGFQDGKEVNSMPKSEAVDFATGDKSIEPGAGQENCEAGIALENDSPLQIKIINAQNSKDTKAYTLTVDPKTL